MLAIVKKFPLPGKAPERLFFCNSSLSGGRRKEGKAGQKNKAKTNWP
jgi:hypothetical protein